MKLQKLFLFFGLLLTLSGCTIQENKPNVVEEEPQIIQIENDITAAYDKVKAGCVGIYATVSQNYVSNGSGVVYKNENGMFYVVTNYHVIENSLDKSSQIKIYQGKHKYYDADVVGYDVSNDLAVLKFSLDIIGGTTPTIIDIFSYDEEIVKIGQTVLAIGCPLGISNYNSLSTGVVSRIANGEIQTNAEINPGNSGGGLFNLSGRLIGINTKKLAYTSSKDENGNYIPIEGMSYAIGLQTVKKCISDIEYVGGGKSVSRPVLGLSLTAVNRYINPENASYLPNSVDEALVVSNVSEGPAQKAGIQSGDVVLKFDGEEITTLNGLKSILNLKRKGEKIVLEIYRKGTEVFSVTIDL